MKEVKVTNSSIRTIREGDPYWKIIDGLVACNRAGFEIPERCPNSWKPLILEAIERGFIKPVAYMKDSELTWEILQNEQR